MHRSLRRVVAAPLATTVVAFSVPAFAQDSGTGDPVTDIVRQQLIARGKDLFFNETFEGNGRTCGTCHPITENLTINAEFIQQLHETNPNDPLFVAEFNPDLAELEDPELMLSQGLILENLDGFDQPGMMRGVPHTLALPTSSAPDADADSDQVTTDGFRPANALGWSADGSAPPDGSMHTFPIGAVMQHFPKTLNRVEGVDFRLPTEEELTAMEAFMLSTGRQQDLNLDELEFLDEAAERGHQLFDGVGTNRACSFCHSNAGANVEQVDEVTGEVELFNDNFDTGTRTLDVGATIDHPFDGGFDVVPFEGIPGRGNGTFNVAPLIEVADTAPFFHNNAALTLEDAIRFYTTDAFANSPSGQNGGAFQLDDQQIADIAAFLRALNARENALIAATDVEVSLEQRDPSLIAGALADAQDGLQVLQESNIAFEAQDRFADAITLLQNPADVNSLVLANLFLRAAVQNLVPEVPGMTVEEEIRARRNPQPLPPPEEEVPAGEAVAAK
jgi:cytochrome c peroxidase